MHNSVGGVIGGWQGVIMLSETLKKKRITRLKLP